MGGFEDEDAVNHVEFVSECMNHSFIIWDPTSLELVLKVEVHDMGMTSHWIRKLCYNN